MRTSDADILFVPGLGNSGAGHWQCRWSERLSTARIVGQADWDTPTRDDWVVTLNREIVMATRPVVLVAHSLGVLAVVHAAQNLIDTKVRGAFLVSAPDVELHADAPRAAREFAPIPRNPLPFPSLYVGSETDPYCAPERAAELASCWGSDFHMAGDAGHINVQSGHGPWPEGLVMFTRLMQRLRA